MFQPPSSPLPPLAASGASAVMIDPQAVFVASRNAEVTCYWCNKVLQACDGRRTLVQVSELLHLPLAVCLKVAGRAQERGWIKVKAPGQVTLWKTLLATLGEDGEALLRQAAQMSRCEPGQIPTQEVGHFLIALELLLPEAQRVGVIPTLDRLHEQYACATRKR